jgi:hypothetical protein
MSSQKIAPQEYEMFQSQTDELIKPYLSKPLEEQDAVEGTRFKAKNTHGNSTDWKKK